MAQCMMTGGSCWLARNSRSGWGFSHRGRITPLTMKRRGFYQNTNIKIQNATNFSHGASAVHVWAFLCVRRQCPLPGVVRGGVVARGWTGDGRGRSGGARTRQRHQRRLKQRLAEPRDDWRADAVTAKRQASCLSGWQAIAVIGPHQAGGFS